MGNITIVNRSGETIATVEAADMRDAIQQLAANGADLGGANLRSANLRGADLRGADLGGANLGGANLYGADLYGADLRSANLRGANLGGANLGGADLGGANLGGADLEGADLEGADLRSANLRSANLGGADLYGANLRGANLYGANLYGANLEGAENIERAKLPPFQICPQEGAFIAYKMAYSVETENRVVLTLEIPAEARRTSSLVGRKCRASATKVLSASDGGGEYFSSHDHDFRYFVGAIATPDSFNPDIRIECTSGIHFFITKQEAEDYQ